MTSGLIDFLCDFLLRNKGSIKRSGHMRLTFPDAFVIRNKEEGWEIEFWPKGSKEPERIVRGDYNDVVECLRETWDQYNW